MSRIYLSKAVATDVEEQFVLDALRSGWIAPLGPHVDAFEREVAERVGVDHALALASGTAALHLALLGLGAEPGTAVVVPSMTFAASAMPVVYTGAEPVFVDAEPDGNVDPGLLFHAIDTLQSEGTRVVAAMTVDLFGRCADYATILPGLEERGVPLIEDAAEALGATFHAKAAGSFGAMAALSFNGNKIMTTSGGGMLLSDDPDVIGRARYLSTQARQPVDYYEHVDIGFNYRLSNILAALGRAQLSRLDEMLARRREIRQLYVDGLDGIPGVAVLGQTGDRRADDEDNCWLTCIQIDSKIIDVTPEKVISELAGQDIETRRLWKPMHLQPVFAARRSFLSGRSERLFDRGVALPSGSSLRDDEIQRVLEALRRTLGVAG
jgi:dTDP-4-amino-4,6-dideoxygalactose transaminase